MSNHKNIDGPFITNKKFYEEDIETYSCHVGKWTQCYTQVFVSKSYQWHISIEVFDSARE